MATNQLLITFFAFCVLLVSASVIELQATQVSTVVNEYPFFYYGGLAGVGDLAFTSDLTKNEARILKRGADGTYSPLTGTSLRNESMAVTTNGDWFGSIFRAGIELFRVSKDGQVSDYSVIEAGTTDFVAKIHQDGSLMVAFSSFILTYEFDNGNGWVITHNSSFPDATFFVNYVFSAAVQDNAFVAINEKINADKKTYNVNIVTRQTDKTWTISDTVVVNSSFVSEAPSFYWDGANTLIFAPFGSNGASPPLGIVTVFNKVNGEWTLSQYFSAASVGVTGFGYFGLGPLVALDNNNVLVAAPADGVYAADDSLPPNTGAVYLMQRNQQNEWNFVAKFRSDASILSAGLAKNDKDVLVLGCLSNDTFFCSLYTFPTCVVDPIDYTCPQQQDSCSVDLDQSLVVVNNPSCGQVTTSYSRIKTDKNGITVDVTLSRPLVDDAKCSVVFTCAELTTVSSGRALVSYVSYILVLVVSSLLL